jgi:hypothetical protein
MSPRKTPKPDLGGEHFAEAQSHLNDAYRPQGDGDQPMPAPVCDLNRAQVRERGDGLASEQRRTAEGGVGVRASERTLRQVPV